MKIDSALSGLGPHRRPAGGFHWCAKLAVLVAKLLLAVGRIMLKRGLSSSVFSTSRQSLRARLPFDDKTTFSTWADLARLRECWRTQHQDCVPKHAATGYAWISDLATSTMVKLEIFQAGPSFA